jgi:hypothetical protein
MSLATLITRLAPGQSLGVHPPKVLCSSRAASGRIDFTQSQAFAIAGSSAVGAVATSARNSKQLQWFAIGRSGC